jgi:large repetitive protein
MKTTAKVTALRPSALAGWGLSLAMAALVVGAAAIAAPRVAPINVEPPTITGTARVGEALSARNGTWANAPTDFRYRWLRCNRFGRDCLLLAADGQTYRVGQADVGRTLRVRVTAVNADGATSARSDPTEVVVANLPPLQNTSRPTITGEARVGQELTANEGTWSGNPTSFDFQWQRCDVDSFTCLDVVGATGRTYGGGSPTWAFACESP